MWTFATHQASPCSDHWRHAKLLFSDGSHWQHYCSIWFCNGVVTWRYVYRPLSPTQTQAASGDSGLQGFRASGPTGTSWIMMFLSWWVRRPQRLWVRFKLESQEGISRSLLSFRPDFSRLSSPFWGADKRLVNSHIFLWLGTYRADVPHPTSYPTFVWKDLHG